MCRVKKMPPYGLGVGGGGGRKTMQPYIYILGLAGEIERKKMQSL